MVHQPIPGSGPQLLVGQETSPLIEFFVPGEAEETFLRVIALSGDNEPLGGEAPTFQIRAGSGVITTVSSDAGEVDIPGGDGRPVGTVRGRREPKDIFLITISNVVENSGPWKIRFRNNDPEPLRFFGFSSHVEEQTLQPWMRLGDPSTSFISSHVEFVDTGEKTIEVRNWGTTPLLFNDEPGPLGDPGSNLILKSIPSQVDPHQVDVITVEATQVDRRQTLAHVFSCNDTVEAHAELSLEITPPTPGRPQPERSDFFCRRGCGCDDFLGSATAAVCERATCGHERAAHLPI